MSYPNLSSRHLQHISRRSILGAGLFAGSSLLIKACTGSSPSESAAGGGELIATTFAGSWEQLYRDVLVPAFTEASGGSASLVPMVSLEQIAKLQASPQSPPFDVVLLDEGPFNAAPKELFQKVPVDQLSNYDAVLPALKSDEGWGPTTGVQVIGIAYNPETVASPPTSWNDLLDPQYKGRVSMQGMQTTQGTSVMVQFAKMNGGSEADIEPAFALLQEQLKPNLTGIAANSGALATLFQQGEIDLAPHDLNNVISLQEKGLSVDWVAPQEGGIALRPAQQIVANTETSIELAAAFIDAALSLEVQSAMADAPYYFLPANQNVELSGILAEKLGSNTEEALSKLVLLDWSEINPRRTEWIERFDKEVQA
ncbi:ABC transporter substrate-binding protein [Romeria aff. gracilis LEGE 07310]|uniref:ABC transporter substrate-binding protein n=1 Tax=Vasconcelosia minhoensis LEGE 07310 TaxID=915328 RepID=A0A8J7AZD1_9CYAN|nr:ABC transporter substrate-binding protein [Romeria gracilis]MBE9079182.1 ABC transporter substrate-binding protein [Romeria aff. gracilis LEGE 07310]